MENANKTTLLKNELSGSTHITFYNSGKRICEVDGVEKYNLFDSCLGTSASWLSFRRGVFGQISLGHILGRSRIKNLEYRVLENRGNTKRIVLLDNETYIADMICEYGKTDFKNDQESIFNRLVDSISKDATYRLDRDRVIIGVDVRNLSEKTILEVRGIAAGNLGVGSTELRKLSFLPPRHDGDLLSEDSCPNNTIGFVINGNKIELFAMDSESGNLLFFIKEAETYELNDEHTKILLNHRDSFLRALSEAEKNINDILLKGN